MNADIENVFMILHFEAYNDENPFTKEQREALVKQIEKTQYLELNIKKPFSFVKNIMKIKHSIEDYEKLFKLFGGDVLRLENKLKDIRGQRLKVLSDLVKIK